MAIRPITLANYIKTITDRKQAVIELLNLHGAPTRSSIPAVDLDKKVRKEINRNKDFARSFTELMYIDVIKRSNADGYSINQSDAQSEPIGSWAVREESYSSEDTAATEVKGVEMPEYIELAKEGLIQTLNSQSDKDKTVTSSIIIDRSSAEESKLKKFYNENKILIWLLIAVAVFFVACFGKKYFKK